MPAAHTGSRRQSTGAGASTEAEVVEIMLPPAGAPGSFTHTLWKSFVDIQEERVNWEGWGVLSL